MAPAGAGRNISEMSKTLISEGQGVPGERSAPVNEMGFLRNEKNAVRRGCVL